MSNHDLKFATIIPATALLGESTFAAARRSIEGKYGVSPVEVFLDVVQSDGVVTAGDVTLDLDQLGLRYLVFGADRPAVSEAVLAEPIHEDLTGTIAGGTTTTTTS